MRLIEGITASAFQENSVTLPNGTVLLIELRYIEMQRGWFIERIVYEDFNLNGLRICNSPNILHQYRNLIPFGLACETNEGREPSLLTDFDNNDSRLYLLTLEETQEFSRALSGQV